MAFSLRSLFRVVFVLVVLLVVLIVGFRSAAYWREGGNEGSPKPATGQTLKTTEGQFFVTSTGTSGQPVLLLHGTGAWGGLWQETADALASAGFVAHAMDLPPFGYSSRPADRDYSRSAQAKRVLAVAATLPKKPVLVAHSFGASSGVEAALINPDAFAGLVIVSGALSVGSHKPDDNALLLPLRPAFVRESLAALTLTNPLATRWLLGQMLYRKDRATEKYADILRQPLSRAGTPPAIADWVPTLLVPPHAALSTRVDAYKDLQLETEIIWGDKDTVTPLEQAKQLDQLIPSSRLTVLPDIGHVPQVEDPAELQAALIAALKRITAFTN